MNKREALEEAVRRWGKRACVQDDKRVTATKETRAAAALELAANVAAKPDPVNREAYREWRTRGMEIMHRLHRCRFSVGELEPYFGAFVVHGSGDTWAEAFAAVDAKACAGAAR